MRRRGLAFDEVIASPARRVRETVEYVVEAHHQAPKPQFRDELYESSAAQYLSTVRKIDDSAQSVLVVGHNPALQELAIQLADPDEPLLESITRKFPTAALLVVELPVRHWAKVVVGRGRLVSFVQARDLERKHVI